MFELLKYESERSLKNVYNNSRGIYCKRKSPLKELLQILLWLVHVLLKNL